MPAAEPLWISKDALLVLHDRSIALHGGAPGLRDEGLLESALVRPANRFHYEGVDDVCVLCELETKSVERKFIRVIELAFVVDPRQRASAHALSQVFEEKDLSNAKTTSQASAVSW